MLRVDRKYIGIKYVYGNNKVEKMKVYNNPLTLGDNIFWYCVRYFDDSLAVVPDKLLFDTIDACWKAEEERENGMKEFFDSMKKKEDIQYETKL